MIAIALQPEPADFGMRVRRPGNVSLRGNPNPTSREWNKCWKRCLPALCAAYNSICAYSACWIPAPAKGTVDHFWPKTIRPDLAYEWKNYRLASEKLNSYKGESTDVADPMGIQPGWFTLDFHSFYVVPGNNLVPQVQELVETSISTLRLNSDDSLVNQRFEIVRDYAKGHVSLRFLERRYPFIAAELRRQGLTQAIKRAFT